jgi:hypothetical protein
MPPSSALLAGRYRLASEIGRGGMGVVWAAHDELLQRDVAVKEVHFPPSLGAEDVQRLSGRTLREARAVAAVDTPSVVRVFDIVEQDGRPWIVMELLRGRTLTEAVAQEGSLPQQEVARIGLALVDALEASHAAGILHRDVKPGNVLLVDGGRVALTDFGIATAAGETNDATTGVVLGSPSYVAPERFQGMAPAAASDYWALGATLWTAAEGHPPYGGADPYAVVTAVATSAPPPLTQTGPVLRDLLLAVMDRDPSRRPGPEQIRQGLNRVLEEPEATLQPTAPLTQPLVEDFDRTTVLGAAPRPVTGAPPVRPVTAAPPVRPTAAPAGQRRVVPAAVAVAAAAVVLAGGALALNHDSSGTAAPAAPARTTAPAATTRPSAAAAPTSAATTKPATKAGSYTDPAIGWSVDVPQGWNRKTVDAGTRFTDPSSGRYVLIATRYPAGPSAVGAWRDAEGSFRSSHRGYQRIRLETISGDAARGAADAADWEFTYDGGGRTLHALDRALVFGKRGYAVYVQAPVDQWDASQSLFNAVQASFRPGS